MKRFLIFLAMFFVLGGVMAQDIILTNDGRTIEARNIRREGNMFRYSLYASSIMSNSTYTIDISNVKIIKYEDGHTFDPNAKVEAAPVPKPVEMVKAEKKEGRDTIVAYAIMEPNKQLSPKLYNAYPPYKNPATAFVSSLVLAGLGQLYNDELSKGFLFMGGDLALAVFSVATLSKQNYTMGYVCIGLDVLLRVVASVEAAISADELNYTYGYLSLLPAPNTNNLAAFGGEVGFAPGIGVSLSF